ncbi:MAG: RNA polymerase sigma factor [Actinobacteria bacterium]|nr:RNA polymerase sigma factor [Actinomycetota bacterium]
MAHDEGVAGRAPAGAPPGPAAPPSDDDATVIRHSLSDPERFTALVHRHGPAVTRYVTRRIGGAAAEDVAAETFLIAFRQRASYAGDGRDCLPWLYGIATRLCHRHWRSETRQLRLLARTGADPVMEPFTDRVEARVAASAIKQRLASALASLPKAQRDALLLQAWADLTYNQIATATGVRLGTVQSRISRARRRLREQLADLNPMQLDQGGPR